MVVNKHYALFTYNRKCIMVKKFYPLCLCECTMYLQRECSIMRKYSSLYEVKSSANNDKRYSVKSCRYTRVSYKRVCLSKTSGLFVFSNYQYTILNFYYTKSSLTLCYSESKNQAMIKSKNITCVVIFLEQF